MLISFYNRVEGKADKSPNRTSADREKEELKKTIKKLEGRLNTINAAEKPLEEGQEDPDQDVLEKQVREILNFMSN